MFQERSNINQWIYEQDADVISHAPAHTKCTWKPFLRSDNAPVRMFVCVCESVHLSRHYPGIVSAGIDKIAGLLQIGLRNVFAHELADLIFGKTLCGKIAIIFVRHFQVQTGVFV